MVPIDLRSDTATRPTAAMREAMATAEVGDEQRGEDPSVNELCERVATLLGQDSGLFLPTGIMSNLIATCVHCEAGDEIIAADNSHIYHVEAGGGAAIAGVTCKPVRTERGIFSIDDLNQLRRMPNNRRPHQQLVAVEQTTNRGGGAVWPVKDLEMVCNWSRTNGLKLHLDGARLFNASIASGHAPIEYAQHFDSAWICLSKGLGCPGGAVLTGSEQFIAAAWRWKHRLGGAARQVAGLQAAAGLYALDCHIDRLAVDHANARLLGELLSASSDIDVMPIETNIVLFKIAQRRASSEKMQLESKLRDRGVLIGQESANSYRAITHLDVDEDQIRTAAKEILQLTA